MNLLTIRVNLLQSLEYLVDSTPILDIAVYLIMS